MFSCEISEVFKNTFFEEHLRTTTSEDITLELFMYVLLPKF